MLKGSETLWAVAGLSWMLSICDWDCAKLIRKEFVMGKEFEAAKAFIFGKMKPFLKKSPLKVTSKLEYWLVSAVSLVTGNSEKVIVVAGFEMPVPLFREAAWAGFTPTIPKPKIEPARASLDAVASYATTKSDLNNLLIQPHSIFVEKPDINLCQ